MNKLLVSISISFMTAMTFAGTDHDHGAPTFQPPKGGTLQSTHKNHFEMVKKSKNVFLYVYDQQGKAMDTKGFKLTTDLEIPRAKTQTIILADKGTHWESEINSNGAHRFTVKIKIDDGKEKDDVKFTFENK